MSTSGVIIGATPSDPLLAGNDLILFGPFGLNFSGQGSTHKADWINGQAGSDFIFGANGDDILIGGGGNDLLLGGRGIDRLAGGTGDDVLTGGPGADFMRGGTGIDLLIWDDDDLGGVWQTVADPFAVGSAPSFVAGGSHSPATTSTYAGNEDFDIVVANFSHSGDIDLSGKNIATVEAVASSKYDHDAQAVTASLAEMRSENESANSSGADLTRDTVFAAVLGGQTGDGIDLLTDGQAWTYDSGAAATALSASELDALEDVYGRRLSLGNDGNSRTIDLTAYVFVNGDASVTVWSDLAASAISLDGSLLV
jgi:hypothetical protein